MVLRFIFGPNLKAKSTVKGLYFVLMRAEVAQGLATVETDVHLLIYELTIASTLVMDKRRLIEGQLVASVFHDSGRLIFDLWGLGVELTLELGFSLNHFN